MTGSRNFCLSFAFFLSSYQLIPSTASFFYNPSPGFSWSFSCSFPRWSRLHGDPGDCRWLHPEHMDNPAPLSLLHLTTDVVCWGCPAKLSMVLGHNMFRIRCKRLAAFLEYVEFAADGFPELPWLAPMWWECHFLSWSSCFCRLFF